MDSEDQEPVLSDDDALSLWVGRVAREHALLEYGVDNVYRFLWRLLEFELSKPSLKGLDQLVGECQVLLRKTDASQELLASGHAALQAAREATQLRNRVVHDMWLPAPTQDDREPPRWNSFQRSGDPQASYVSATIEDLETVTSARAILARTRLRVSGLFMALHATWPMETVGRGSLSASNNLPRYFALMTDRFILHSNGDFEVI